MNFSPQEFLLVNCKFFIFRCLNAFVLAKLASTDGKQGPRSTFWIGGLKSNREPEGVWGETPRKIFYNHALYFGYKCDQRPFPMANSPWKRQLSSEYPITKASFIAMYSITFYFHREKAQPGMKGLKLTNYHNLVELLSPKNNDMETQCLYFQKQTF